jgi:hypothetical protein
MQPKSETFMQSGEDINTPAPTLGNEQTDANTGMDTGRAPWYQQPSTHPLENTVIDSPETSAQQEKSKPKNRYTHTFVLNAEEEQYLQQVFEARNQYINAGVPLSKDWNQFIRQCVNFAVNFEPGWMFSRPDIPKVYLTNL